MLDTMRSYIASDGFEEDISNLHNGTYSFSPPEKRKLFFGNDEKTRNIWVFPERETNFQRLIFYALHGYDNKFSACIQYGLEKTVPWEGTLHRINNYDELYFFTTDIHRCSDSIDREILLGKLADFIDDDPALLKYLRDFVQCRQCIKDGALCDDRCAVPAGSPLSCFLVNLYLRELDQCIEPKADFYARLTDRIVIGCFAPEKLRVLEKTALEVLSRLGLTVNEDETLFLNPGEPFDFQGKRVTGKEIDFSPENLAYIQRSLRRQTTYAKRKMRGMKPRTRAVLCIFVFETGPLCRHFKKSFSTVTTDRSYKILDHYIQNLLREIITGKSGNAKYSCTYDDLRSYGYRSLTGQYYKYLNNRERKS